MLDGKELTIANMQDVNFKCTSNMNDLLSLKKMVGAAAVRPQVGWESS